LAGSTILSVLVANRLVGDGKTNRLEGGMLVASYAMIAAVFLHGTVEMTQRG